MPLWWAGVPAGAVWLPTVYTASQRSTSAAASGRSVLAQGMDSLNANDLRGRLQRALPVKVNVLFLLRGDSPLHLSDRVFEQLADTLTRSHEATSGHPHPAGAEPGRAPQATRPDAEVLHADIRSAGAKPMEGREPRAILLTGASGFLGCFTLAELLRRTRATVQCHVRAENDRAAMERVRSRLMGAQLWEPEMARRIVPLAGDLAQPRLGAPPARWEALAGEIDAVFHVGCAVNFLFSYDDLRPANVLSTVELLRLASSIRIKPLHFGVRAGSVPRPAAPRPTPPQGAAHSARASASDGRRG
jgi:hypothetical protein